MSKKANKKVQEKNAEINWEWYEVFEIPDVYDPKQPCPSYYTWMEPTITFRKHKPFKGFSYITTIENAFLILKNGITYEPLTTFSVVKEQKLHPLHNEGVLVVSPTFGLGQAAKNSKGNVQFTSFDLSMYSDCNFYIVEFLKYKKQQTVRVLATTRKYDLHQINIKEEGGPIFLDEDGFFVAREFFYKDTDHKVTIEVLVDNISFRSMQYVSCANPESAIKDDVYEGKIAAFDSDLIGQLFYCLLLHQNKSSKHKYNVCFNIDIVNLMKAIKESQRNVNAANFDITEIGLFPTDNANKCLASVELDNVIQSNTHLNLKDYDTIKKMAKMYQCMQQSPDGFTIVATLHKAYVKFLRECGYGAKRNFSTMMTCLLNHFMTEEQANDVKAAIVEYIRKQITFGTGKY